MPIYEYECTSCHHHFDLMQKVSEEPIKQCPECSEHSAVRWISAAGFQLKGTGWYATDFKTKNNINKESSAKKEDSSQTPKTTTKESAAQSSTSNSTKGDTE